MACEEVAGHAHRLIHREPSGDFRDTFLQEFSNDAVHAHTRKLLVELGRIQPSLGDPLRSNRIDDRFDLLGNRNRSTQHLGRTVDHLSCERLRVGFHGAVAVHHPLFGIGQSTLWSEQSGCTCSFGDLLDQPRTTYFGHRATS